MKDPIIVEAYNVEWPAMFLQIGQQMRRGMGSSAIRIDHIGSTAVPGLVAKPVLDIQISVVDFNDLDSVKNALGEMGYRHRLDNEDLSKRYFRESQGMSRTHIHIRESGSWSEQFNLLFRDYLRAHETERAEYGQLKINLANKFNDHREAYLDGKTDLIWIIMQKANKWSQEVGWNPCQSDC